MIKHLLWLLLLCMATLLLPAQEKIETDRPSESQSAWLVGKGTFQAKLGFRKQQENGRDYSLHHPDALFR